MQSMESMMPQWKVYHGDISLSIGFRGIDRSIRLGWMIDHKIIPEEFTH